MSDKLITVLSLIDAVLDRWRIELAGDFAAYRGHVFRVFNLARPLLADAPHAEEKLAVAAVFHDLGIWTHATFDYLAPSRALAREYLEQIGRAAWSEEVALAIDMHHRLRPYRGPYAALVEALRRADLADLSLGMLASGCDRALLRRLHAEFPNAGFHRRLMILSLRWGSRHPFKPLPMMKF